MKIMVLTRFIKKNYILLLFFGAILFIYIQNTFHTNFPDEFDNIVGGWYITKGILPYKGFFSHHNPGAYYISSLITFISGQSFVRFRTVWSFLLFAFTSGSYLFLRKHLGTKESYFYLGFIFILAVGATYYWGHMMLSETVVGYILIPTYAFFLIKTVREDIISFHDISLLSVATFIAVVTSLTFIYAIALFILYTLFIFLKQHNFRRDKILTVFVMMAVPYFLFLLYLVVTGSFSEYVYQSIHFNRLYYIYNFPKVGDTVSTNPVRYAMSIFYNTSIQFHSLLVQVKNFNFSYPVNLTLLLGNISVITYLVLMKKYATAALVYGMMVFLNARSEPLNFQETDFHSTVYIMLSLLNTAYGLSKLALVMETKITQYAKMIISVVLIVTGIYTLFMILFLSRSFMEKTYLRFMGQAPGIYDRPVVAPIINQLVTKNDFFWIGPFEFQELLYINGKLPSKYHWFLPASERSDKIKKEIVDDLTRNRPKLIVFKDNLDYFGTKPEDYNYPIVKFLTENYFRLIDIEKEGIRYVPVVNDLHNFNVAGNFYYDKNRKDEIIKELLAKDIIRIAN